MFSLINENLSLSQCSDSSRPLVLLIDTECSGSLPYPVRKPQRIDSG